MKKLFLIGFAILSMGAMAQSVDFGLKAGMAYNTDKGVLKTIEEAYETKGKGAVGFQAGAMIRAKFAGFYLQPEVLYTHFKNEYKKEAGESIDVKKDRIDIPINVGKTFALGLVQVQTGPVFSFNISDKANHGFGSADKKDDMSLGWQVGTGLNFKKLNLDLRYEFGLGKTSSEFIQGAAGTDFKTENRTNMLNFTVGYFL